MSARRVWREAYRLARLTPCKEGANTTWTQAYPWRVGFNVLTSAWTGKHGDVLKWGIASRANCHRNGLDISYTLHGRATPRLPA